MTNREILTQVVEGFLMGIGLTVAVFGAAWILLTLIGAI